MTAILKTPLVSEKSSSLAGDLKFVFLVEKNANKIQIKKIVEGHFGVNVRSVNIVNLKPKQRTRGRLKGYTKARKKAIVTLKDSEGIENIKKLF